jgi:hypothetical protein
MKIFFPLSPLELLPLPAEAVDPPFDPDDLTVPVPLSAPLPLVDSVPVLVIELASVKVDDVSASTRARGGELALSPIFPSITAIGSEGTEDALAKAAAGDCFWL